MRHPYAVVLLAVTGQFLAFSHAQPAAAMDQWQPDPAQVALLTDHATATPYEILLPKGAHGQHQQINTAKTLQTQYVWNIGQDLNVLVIITRSQDGGTLPEPAAALDTWEHATVEACDNPVRAKKEIGSVDGLPVTRDRYTYTSPDKSKTKMAGFNYAAQTGGVLVIVGAVTADASKAKDIPLAEAAALNFLKNVAKPQ